jgi:predicted nucleotidyltransferase
MNKIIEQFLEELKQNPKVLGIILFGSWARGNNRPDSDMDLVVILSEGYRRTVEFRDGQAFEIIYTTAPAAVDFWKNNKDDCYGLWQVAKVLYDKDGTINKLKKEAEEIIKSGKEQVDEYQIGQYKFSAEDEIRAIEAMVEKDVTTANLLISRLALLLLEQFFDIKKLWTPAPNQRLSVIKEVNLELYHLLTEFYKEGNDIKNRIDLIKNMILTIFKI